jgi:hypothetical protein
MRHASVRVAGGAHLADRENQPAIAAYGVESVVFSLPLCVRQHDMGHPQDLKAVGGRETRMARHSQLGDQGLS